LFQELFRPANLGVGELTGAWAGSLTSVGREEWSRISRSCGLYLSYPFLLSVEESVSTPCAYLLLRDRGGTLIAGLPVYQWDGSPDAGLDHYEPVASAARWVLGESAPAAPWRPTLLIGTRAGYATEFPVDPGWQGERQDVVGRLLAGAAERADSVGAASLAAMWLTSAAARDAAHCLTGQDYLVLAGPNCSIEIKWDSFAGYLAALSPSRRHSARRERQRFAESGLEVDLRDLSSCLEEIAPLAALLQSKYGHALPASEIARQLAAQARHLNAESRVLLCRRGGQLVAFSLLYRWGDTLVGRLAGFDYQATANTDAYFTLAFYKPIELAVEERVQRLSLGMASWRPKALRGASFDPAWTLACPPPSLREEWSRAARAQGDDAASWWAREFPAQVHPRGDWRWSRSGLFGNAAATTSPQ